MSDYDLVASCGRCGEDFVFATSKERDDWYDAHHAEHGAAHTDFVSFFRQGRI